MFGLALALSVIGLAIGPALAAWARGRAVELAALDGATLALVPGVILLHLLPHLVVEAGAWAAGALVLGYVGMQILEARTHDSSARVGTAVVLSTLAIHSFLDGAALALTLGTAGLEPGAATLGITLVLHRVPEGLFVASVIPASSAPRRGAIAVGALVAATLFGALIGRELLVYLPDAALHLVIAAGLGMMLRLLVHRHDVAAMTPRADLAAGIAFVAALGLVLVTAAPQRLFTIAAPDELSVAQAVVPLVSETSLVLVAILLLGELVARRRAPRAAGDSWLASTVLTAWLLGPAFAAIRGLVVPALVWLATRATPSASTEDQRRPWPRAHDTLPPYVIGLALAVAAEAAVPRNGLAGHDAVALPLAALAGGWGPAAGAGAPLVAAILLHKGASVSVAIGYLVAGGLRCVPSRRPLTIGLFGACVAGGLGILLAPIAARFQAPELHELGNHAHPVAQYIAALALAVWALTDLVRLGPRRWFGGRRAAP